MCEFEEQTYRTVVLQWCFQTLELRWQRVMALGHQHDAIKTKREDNTIIELSVQMHKMHCQHATKEEAKCFSQYSLLVLEVGGPFSWLDAGQRKRKRKEWFPMSATVKQRYPSGAIRLLSVFILQVNDNRVWKPTRPLRSVLISAVKGVWGVGFLSHSSVIKSLYLVCTFQGAIPTDCRG